MINDDVVLDAWRKDPHNKTVLNALMVDSAAVGALSRVRACISAGAKPAFEENAALRRAASGGHVDVIEELLAHQADIHSRADEALRAAVAGGYIDTVRLLLEKGANPNVMNGAALSQAVERGQQRILTMLLQADANIHVNDGYILRKAVLHGQTDCIRTLIEHGADPFSSCGAALRLAESLGDEEAEVLLQSEMNRRLYDFMSVLKDVKDPRQNLLADYEGDPVLLRAMKMGVFDQVADIMKQADMPMTQQLLTEIKDKNGHTLLDVAGMAKNIMQVFDPGLWGWNVDEIKKGWEKIPAARFDEGFCPEDGLAAIVAVCQQRALKSKTAQHHKNKYKL